MLEQNDSTSTYMCPECGLHYTDHEVAERCQTWCGQYKSCNLEIAAMSVELKSKRSNVWG